MAVGVPCMLVTSCSSTFSADRLVQHILGTEDAVVEVTANDAVRFDPWTIDNKYYSADINLCVVPNKFLVTAETAESIQAFVVYFDSTQKSHLDSVSSWLPLAESWLPEVMILVCNRVSENGVNRQKAQEWCIKHGFELVELRLEELPEEDDDFPESTGVKQIVQTSNANVCLLTGANHSIGSAETCHRDLPLKAACGSHIRPGYSRTFQSYYRWWRFGEFSKTVFKVKRNERKDACRKGGQSLLDGNWGDRDEIEGLSSEKEH
ncbi:hypothetical protein K5549_011763 [Capra hircus]|nr:hypothetical protein K5549_011763 [Capra hircus]